MSDWIATVPDLDDLPQRSVVLDRQLVAWQKTMHGDWKFGSVKVASLDLMQAINNFQPLELIFTGPATREGA